MDAGNIVSPADVVGRLVHESEQMRAVHALVDRTLRERALEGEWTIRLELHTRPLAPVVTSIAPPVVIPASVAPSVAPIENRPPTPVKAHPAAARPRAVAVPASPARKPVARAKGVKPGESHSAVGMPRATARVATLKQS